MRSPARRQGGGAEFFLVYNPKRYIFKALSPFFNVIFLLFFICIIYNPKNITYFFQAFFAVFLWQLFTWIVCVHYYACVICVNDCLKLHLIFFRMEKVLLCLMFTWLEDICVPGTIWKGSGGKYISLRLNHGLFIVGVPPPFELADIWSYCVSRK